jgi:hypothetical protein
MTTNEQEYFPESMIEELCFYHELLSVVHRHRTMLKNSLNGVLRGTTNVMCGYWRVVGVTKMALEQMKERGWKGQYAKGLRRDHIKSARKFQSQLFDREEFPSWDEFGTLVADYGDCVITTKDENPPQTEGYGHSYVESDVMWLSAPFDTHSSIGVPEGRMFERYQSASAENSRIRRVWRATKCTR